MKLSCGGCAITAGIEGQNIDIEWRYLDGHSERIPDLVAELVSRPVDVIVSGQSPTLRAIAQATTTIPIVMAGVVDPVGAGFIASLSHPGGNVTGLDVTEDGGKQLELL